MIWISFVTAAVAFLVTFGLGFVIIPMLHKLKFGQTILDIGPAWHKEKKQGIPTMGGWMFIAGSAAAFAVGVTLLYLSGTITFDGIGSADFFKGVSGLLMAVCFGFIGFLDDFIKVKRKQNEGLSPNQKILLQILVIAAYFTTRVLSGDTSTFISIPFLGQLDLWYFYYVLMGLGIIYIVNAVNLTDGIDGLCSCVTFVYAAVFVVICSMVKLPELSLLATAVGGGCLGFLVWNFHPAKVIMGDTGSLFLGGIVVALGIGAHAEVLMIIAAAVYIWEALTVLIQMTYFKITHGKRLFKMTPIHHSFEKRGWKEEKICAVFSLLALLAGAVAILLVFGI